MSKLLDLIDKYKFGLIAAIATYIGLFMYFQMDTYTSYYQFEPFHDGSYVELENREIEMNPDNIEVPPDFKAGEVKNMAADRNDARKKSYENYAQDKRTAKEVEQSVKEMEAQMYQDAGGEARREKIRQQMEASQSKQTQKPTSTNQHATNQSGSENAYAGKTMVEFDLKGRTAFQNNKWYVRNPGYTCGYGSGEIVVDVKVNQNGNVVSAVYNPTKSSGGNQCMVDQAIKYAKMSRFNYSSSAPSSQSGQIFYFFVSQ